MRFGFVIGPLMALATLPALAMDLVRTETRMDLAVAKYGVSGQNVIVAILDRGIDYTHPDFIKPNGDTRIEWLLDMSNAGPNPCDPNDPPPIEYSEAQINDALHGGDPLPTRDAVGHGVVTTGLAAGNGSAFAGGQFAGMAPEADLIIVKLTSEGAPAHDDQPAEDFFQGCNTYALDWLDDKLAELGKPCVGLINSGVQWGPIDGTSVASAEIDQTFGENTPGRVYVAASGDEGAFPSHAGAEYDDAADTVINFDKLETFDSVVTMWYSGEFPAEVTVTLGNDIVVGPCPPESFIDDPVVGIFIQQFVSGEEFYPWTSTSGDRAVYILLYGGYSGPGSLRIRGTTSGAGFVDAYNPSGDIVSFTDHLVPGRLTDYASTPSAIVVGAYVSRNNWIDIDGIPRSDTAEGLMGELWLHSSPGPTRDGRLHGVDICTPGHSAFAAYGQDSYWATFRFNLIQEGGGWYGRGGATSGAAPIGVGAVALMLDLCPTLTAAEVREILRGTARTDDFTGGTPNADWGFGKLDMPAALDALNAMLLGDFNCDRVVDEADAAIFVEVLLGLDAQPRHVHRADMNGDGNADGDDIADFVAVVIDG